MILAKYLYLKCLDTRLEIVSAYQSRVILTELYLASLGGHPISYYPHKRSIGYTLPSGKAFRFKWKVEDSL